MIQGPEFDDLCKRGEPVACGQKLRLEHLTTNRLTSLFRPQLTLTSSLPRNLHSHHFSSPLTNQQEVSAFGEMGEGDTGDVWKVMILIEKRNIYLFYQRLFVTLTTGKGTRQCSSSTWTPGFTLDPAGRPLDAPSVDRWR